MLSIIWEEITAPLKFGNGSVISSYTLCVIIYLYIIELMLIHVNKCAPPKDTYMEFAAIIVIRNALQRVFGVAQCLSPRKEAGHRCTDLGLDMKRKHRALSVWESETLVHIMAWWLSVHTPAIQWTRVYPTPLCCVLLLFDNDFRIPILHSTGTLTYGCPSVRKTTLRNSIEYIT